MNHSDRIRRLRDKMNAVAHGVFRIRLPADWDTSHCQGGLAERKALALKRMCERMPVFIDDDELIVGSRTALCANNDGLMNLHGCANYKTTAELAMTGGRSDTTHALAGYQKVLSQGVCGISRQVERRRDEETNPEKRGFLNAVLIACDGPAILARRYAELAEQMAARAEGRRKSELTTIAEVCRAVICNPPQNLHEAMQLFWFAHLVVQMENYWLMTYGRLDQHLFPYWATVPEAQAKELLSCLLIKMNDTRDLPYYESENLVIAGYRPDGGDGTNAVTYACLEALETLRLPNPTVNVRLNQQSPPALVQKTCELFRQGLAQLACYNDDAIVPALMGAGFPAEDARDWALDACQDILIEGKSKFIGPGYNALGMTELLLETMNEAEGNEFADFNDLLDHFKQKLSSKIAEVAAAYRQDLKKPLMESHPFLSATIDDSISKGLDCEEGGYRYNDKGLFLSSPVNAINGLAAVKKVVFEEKQATYAEVVTACRNNFEGQGELRSRLLSAPKWGNDDDAVDLLGKDIIEYGCHEIQKHRIDEHSKFLSGVHQAGQVGVGKQCPATPDGRKAGEPFPVTLSPANGTALKGPTAIIKSITKIDPMVFQWNSSLTLSLHPTALRGEDGLRKLEMLLKTYLELGGVQMQLNVVEAETLRAARKQPEQYRDLVVRVWGYCARFTELSPEYQEEIIARVSNDIW